MRFLKKRQSKEIEAPSRTELHNELSQLLKRLDHTYASYEITHAKQQTIADDFGGDSRSLVKYHRLLEEYEIKTRKVARSWEDIGENKMCQMLKYGDIDKQLQELDRAANRMWITLDNGCLQGDDEVANQIWREFREGTTSIPALQPYLGTEYQQSLKINLHGTQYAVSDGTLVADLCTFTTEGGAISNIEYSVIAAVSIPTELLNKERRDLQSLQFALLGDGDATLQDLIMQVSHFVSFIEEVQTDAVEMLRILETEEIDELQALDEDAERAQELMLNQFRFER